MTTTSYAGHPVTREKLSKPGIHQAIRKMGGSAPLSTVRFLIAAQKTNLRKRIPGNPPVYNRIRDAHEMSWQERMAWAQRIIDFKGQRAENLEWFTVTLNDPVKAQEMMVAKGDRVRGEKNVFYNHGGKFSPFSEGSANYDPTALKRAHQTLNETRNRPNHVEFYLRRGMTQVEAEKAVKERQATGRLSNFIKRYGEVEGTRRWKERQIKWQATLNAKSDEEKAAIAVLKSEAGTSEAEEMIRVFLVATFGDELERHFPIHVEKNDTWTTGDFRVGNKVVEYNGNYWHCNPEIYTAESYDKAARGTGRNTAAQIWQRDADKKEAIEDMGMELMVIWESDFEKDNMGVMQACRDWLDDQ